MAASQSPALGTCEVRELFETFPDDTSYIAELSRETTPETVFSEIFSPVTFSGLDYDKAPSDAATIASTREHSRRVRAIASRFREITGLYARTEVAQDPFKDNAAAQYEASQATVVLKRFCGLCQFSGACAVNQTLRETVQKGKEAEVDTERRAAELQLEAFTRDFLTYASIDERLEIPPSHDEVIVPNSQKLMHIVTILRKFEGHLLGLSTEERNDFICSLYKSVRSKASGQRHDSVFEKMVHCMADELSVYEGLRNVLGSSNVTLSAPYEDVCEGTDIIARYQGTDIRIDVKSATYFKNVIDPYSYRIGKCAAIKHCAAGPDRTDKPVLILCPQNRPVIRLRPKTHHASQKSNRYGRLANIAPFTDKHTEKGYQTDLQNSFEQYMRVVRHSKPKTRA